MKNEAIEHTSVEKQIFGVKEQIVERKSKKGIAWTCKCFTEFSKPSDVEESVYLGWKFEWTDKTVLGYQGEIIVTSDLADDIRLAFPLKVMKSGEWVERRLASFSECSIDGYRIFQYGFKIHPIRNLAQKRAIKPGMWGSTEKATDKPVFGGLYRGGASSSKPTPNVDKTESSESSEHSNEQATLNCDGFGTGFTTKSKENARKEKNTDKNQNSTSSAGMNDVILLVEGKTISVNKTFLAIHSEYFHKLFFTDNSNNSSEFTIDDVGFNDFERLLGVISPNPEFPDDESVEMLLELADRFELLAVTRQVEHFLKNGSEIGLCTDAKSAEKLLKLADLFNLPSLQSLVELRLSQNSDLCDSIVLAQNYGLEAVMKSLISTIRHKEHMKAIRESEKYKELKDATKLAIYEHYNKDI